MLPNARAGILEPEQDCVGANCAAASKPQARPTIRKPCEANPASKILRFAESERLLHWAIAGPFLVSFMTGAILVIVYNPEPSRLGRGLFDLIHRISGIALSILPMLALLRGRHDIRIHIYNIKQAWTWIYDDFKWLALMGLAAISSRFVLPEQGKFNAAEKLNFMVLMSTYPLYVVTGFLMWLWPMAVLSWIMHCLMAMMATPLILGHLYMALINADTRPGLEGMISGHVDRKWAKHHYGRWYRKHHEPSGVTPLDQPPAAELAELYADPDPSATHTFSGDDQSLSDILRDLDLAILLSGESGDVTEAGNRGEGDVEEL
jgi:formate dehydrogenase subunit gamma